MKWLAHNLAVLGIFLAFTSYAQEKPPAIFDNPKVVNKMTGAPMGGVTVTVEKNGSVVETKTTGSNGKVKLNPIELDAKYKISFTISGFYTRYVEVDLTNIPPAHIPEEGYGFPLDMSMVPIVEGVDYSPLANKPTGIIRYDKREEDVNWDFKVVEAYNSELAKIIKKIEEKQKGAAEADAKFAKLVQEGDAAGTKKDYTTAITKYTEAIAIKNDPAVVAKLDDAKKKQAELEASKGIDKQYQEKITAADAAFKQKDYATAKLNYQEAGKLKPNEPLPPQKIAEIDKLINAEMEKDKNYSTAINDGNKFFDEGKYDDAIKKYTEAQKIKPTEQEPKDLIAKAQESKTNADKKNQEFLAFVKKGDDAVTAKKLDDAISNYTSALDIKKDPAVQAKLDKAKADKANLDKANKEYIDLITQGDNELNGSNWDKAIEAYTKAQALRPSEKYPADQIALAKQKKAEAEKNAATEKQYADLMKQGETDLNAQQWDKAIASFEAAKKFKPAESKPQEMIDLAKQKKQEAADKEKNAAIEKQYTELMKIADADFTASQWDKAISGYEAALKVKPDATKPQEMIEQAKAKKQEALDKEANIKKAKELVAKADAFLPQKKYDDAIALYQEALNLDNNSEYQKKLDAAKKAKDDAELANKEKEAKEKQYQDLIAKADANLNAGEYDKAIADYTSALGLKPGEKYPTDQINLAKQKKADAEKNAALEKQYQDLMRQGETELNASEFDKAIATLEAAKKLKPSESRPQELIDQAKQKKQELLDKEALVKKAKDLVAKADALVPQKKYDDAIKFYEEAIGLDPKPEYQAKLDAVRKTKNDEELALKSKEEQEAKYKEFIQQGDVAFDSGDWNSAISAYTSALGIKANEKYPADQIAKAKAKKAENEALAKKDQEFVEFMAKADADFNAGNWDKAIENYNNALKVKPSEKTPKDQIAIATQKKNEQAAQIASENEKKAKSKAAFDAGMTHYNAGEFDLAISRFEEALTYTPNDKNASDYLEKARQEKDKKFADKKRMYDDMIAFADKEFNAGNYEDAKGYYDRAANIMKDQSYPKERSAEAQKKIDEKKQNEALRSQYNEAIKKADAAFNAAQWSASIPLYEAAKKIIGTETYPDDQIAKANAKIQEQKDLENNKKKLEEEYLKKITEADKFFKSASYDEAIQEYNAALALKPNEQYPKDQIAAANKKKDEIRAKDEQARLDQEYKDLIAQADAAFAASQWDQAIDVYKQAKSKKPAEKYPDDQIAKANQKKAEEAANAANNAKLEEQKRKYQAKVEEADRAFNSEQYEESKKIYAEAMKIKPDETYPQEMIDKANIRLKEISQGEIKKQYDLIIAQADKDFDAGNYADAKMYYERAIKLNATDQHPKNRIEEINKKLNDKLAEEEKRKKYDAIVKRADGELGKNDFDKSIASYNEALGIYPSEQYPKDKIEEAKRLKDELAAKASAKEKYQIEYNKGMNEFNAGAFDKAIVHFEKALEAIPGDKDATKMLEKSREELENKKAFFENQYKAIIAAADENFNNSKWSDAKDLYKRALTFKPNEQYPKDQLEKIKSKENAQQGASDYNKIIAEANKNFNTKNYTEARDLYVKASDLQPTIEYPKKRIKEIDALLGGNSNNSNNQGFNQQKVQNQGNNAPVLKESYYGNPVDIDIKEAQALMAKTKSELDEARWSSSEDEKLAVDEQNRIATNKQDERRIENDQNFTVVEESFETYSEEGEKKRADNVSGYANLKEQREVANSELSGSRNEVLLENSRVYEQMKTDYVYSEVGTDMIRRQNVRDIGDQKEDIYTTETTLEGNATEKRYSSSEQLTQDNYRLTDQLAQEDIIRQEKHMNLSDFKEQRYEMEGTLEGNATEKRLDNSEKLTQDNYTLTDQLAQEDIIRQEKEQNISQFKEDRYNQESTLEGTATEKRLGTSEKLTQDNYTLTDQLAQEDIIRQEKEQNISQFKEDRYNQESTLEGSATEKRYSTSEKLTQDNYTLTDQLAQEDIIRQEKHMNLSDFKEQRYEMEGTLEGNATEKRLGTSEKLTQDNYTLTDQLAQEDIIRQEKEQNIAQVKEDRYNTESTLEGNATEKRQGTKDQLTEELIQRENHYADMGQNAGENNKKLQEEKDFRNLKEEEISSHGDLVRDNNQEKLENTKYQTNDPFSGNTARLVSEKSFQKNDGQGRPLEITIQRMVRDGENLHEYLMITNRTGNSYFKDGKPISETQFSVETAVPKE
ncbi:MAG: hypothetical protein K1X56_04040 [Flavobacteriales bacterium]|nr:hypothetical protein [Flavobacteriales bacterium]